jgi:ribonuclease P/MRP protein subunit POP7
VLAIDDIELEAPHSAEASGEAEDEEGDVEMIAGDEKKSKNGKGKRRGKTMAEDDVPETRIRNLSAVTVAIGLK